VFGRFGEEIRYTDSDVSISATGSGELRRYIRASGGQRVEKILPEGLATVIINPVEPVNLPEPVTRYLEISFPAVVLPAKAVRRMYLTFPLEIGVFLETGGVISVLDLFSLVPAKYSLYGSPGAGAITRWHQSGITKNPPVVDRYRYGILDVTITNTTPGIVEVSRAVFDSNSMHLWYGESVVMTGAMDIYSPMIAQTTVSEMAPSGDMTRCIELYAARSIPSVHGRGHLMEFGVT